MSSVGAGQFIGVESVRTLTTLRHLENQARLSQKPVQKLITEMGEYERLAPFLFLHNYLSNLIIMSVCIADFSREIAHLPASGVASTLITPLLQRLQSSPSLVTASQQVIGVRA